MLPELQRFKNDLSIRTEFSSQLYEDILLTGMCFKKKHNPTKKTLKTQQQQKTPTNPKQSKAKQNKNPKPFIKNIYRLQKNCSSENQEVPHHHLIFF